MNDFKITSKKRLFAIPHRFHKLSTISLLIVFCLLSACSSNPEIVNSRWIITDIAGKSSLEQHTPWLEFFASADTANEGEMKGHSGCNRFFARYKIKDQQIAFSPIGSTRKACPGPEMNQESAIFKLLTTTLDFTTEDSGLQFIYQGEVVLAMVKDEVKDTAQTEGTTEEAEAKKN